MSENRPRLDVIEERIQRIEERQRSGFQAVVNMVANVVTQLGIGQQNLEYLLNNDDQGGTKIPFESEKD